MHRVRVATGIAESDPYTIAFANPQCRPRHSAIICPGGEEHARRDLDLPIDGDHVELAQGSSVRKCRCLAFVPVRQHRSRIEAVAVVTDLTDSRHDTFVVPIILITLDCASTFGVTSEEQPNAAKNTTRPIGGVCSSENLATAACFLWPSWSIVLICIC